MSRKDVKLDLSTALDCDVMQTEARKSLYAFPTHNGKIVFKPAYFESFVDHYPYWQLLINLYISSVNQVSHNGMGLEFCSSQIGFKSMLNREIVDNSRVRGGSFYFLYEETLQHIVKIRDDIRYNLYNPIPLPERRFSFHRSNGSWNSDQYSLEYGHSDVASGGDSDEERDFGFLSDILDGVYEQNQ